MVGMMELLWKFLCGAIMEVFSEIVKLVDRNLTGRRNDAPEK